MSEATESNPSDAMLVRAVLERLKELNKAVEEAHHAGIKIQIEQSANVLWQSYLMKSAHRLIDLVPRAMFDDSGRERRNLVAGPMSEVTRKEIEEISRFISR